MKLKYLDTNQASKEIQESYPGYTEMPAWLSTLNFIKRYTNKMQDLVAPTQALLASNQTPFCNTWGSDC